MRKRMILAFLLTAVYVLSSLSPFLKVALAATSMSTKLPLPEVSSNPPGMSSPLLDERETATKDASQMTPPVGLSSDLWDDVWGPPEIVLISTHGGDFGWCGEPFGDLNDQCKSKVPTILCDYYISEWQSAARTQGDSYACLMRSGHGWRMKVLAVGIENSSIYFFVARWRWEGGLPPQLESIFPFGDGSVRSPNSYCDEPFASVSDAPNQNLPCFPKPPHMECRYYDLNPEGNPVPGSEAWCFNTQTGVGIRVKLTGCTAPSSWSGGGQAYQRCIDEPYAPDSDEYWRFNLYTFTDWSQAPAVPDYPAMPDPGDCDDPRAFGGSAQSLPPCPERPLPDQNPADYIKINGVLKALPLGHKIVPNFGLGDYDNTDYLQVTRKSASWFKEIGVELVYGMDLGGFRTPYVFFGTPSSITAVWVEGSQRKLPNIFSLIDFSRHRRQSHWVRYFGERGVDHFGIRSLFLSLGASSVEKGPDGFYNVEFRPENMVTGWASSCMNHGYAPAGECPQAEFAYNTLWAYYRDVAEKMGLKDTPASAITYYSMLLGQHKVRPFNPMNKAAVRDLNLHAIKYDSADYQVWETLLRDSGVAAAFFLGLIESVQLANSFSYYYPDPAVMHRNAEAIRKELENQRALAGLFGRQIDQTLRTHGLVGEDELIVITPRPVNAPRLPDGRYVFVRYAEKGSASRAGLQHQAETGKRRFGEVPGYPNWVYIEEDVVNGNAIDNIGHFRPPGEEGPTATIYLVDNKLGYAAFFVGKDFSKGVSPHMRGYMVSHVRNNVPKLIDHAKYMRRVTGRSNYKAALHHTDQHFINAYRNLAYETLDRQVLDKFIDFLWTPKGSGQVFFPD